MFLVQWTPDAEQHGIGVRLTPMDMGYKLRTLQRHTAYVSPARNAECTRAANKDRIYKMHRHRTDIAYTYPVNPAPALLR
jgi:hypothetical protein